MLNYDCWVVLLLIFTQLRMSYRLIAHPRILHRIVTQLLVNQARLEEIATKEHVAFRSTRSTALLDPAQGAASMLADGATEEGAWIAIFVCMVALPCVKSNLHIFEPRFACWSSTFACSLLSAAGISCPPPKDDCSSPTPPLRPLPPPRLAFTSHRPCFQRQTRTAARPH